MIGLVDTGAPAVAVREATAVRVALGLVALHVADGAFLRPEPGTAAGDHLLSGLVPIAVAGAVAAAYPRLEHGPRAAAALSCGALALVAGVLAGPLSLIAGLVLVAAGLVELRRVRGWRRRLGFGVAFAVLGYLVLLGAGMAIIGTQKAREAVVAADLGRPYREVTLVTSDGLRLAAWYVPPRNGATVIAFPGRRQPVPHARLLVRHGYGVLLLDPRGTGESDGDVNRFGWGGGPDLDAAVDFLVARGDRVGGLGLSVGGELLLEAADRRPELRAVVSEGAGTRSLREQLHNPGAPEGLRAVSPWTVQTLALMVLAGGSPPPDLTEMRPARSLLIQARDGHADEALNAVYAGERWIAPGGHTAAITAAPQAYERRVVGFLDAALLGDG